MAAVAAVILVEKMLPRGEAFARACCGRPHGGLASGSPPAPDDRAGAEGAGGRGMADADGAKSVSWRIRGSYFESCNCDAICPCRRIDGVPGGRSTHGICMGVLSWLIDRRRRRRHRPVGPPGRAGGALQRRRAGLAVDVDPLSRRSGDRARSGRRSRGSSRAGSAATRRRTSPGRGRRAQLVAVRPVDDRSRPHAAPAVAADPRPRERSHPRPPTAGDEIVTCVIPGHERAGEELVADELVRRGRPVRVQLPRHLRLRRLVRLLGLGATSPELGVCDSLARPRAISLLENVREGGRQQTDPRLRAEG